MSGILKKFKKSIKIFGIMLLSLVMVVFVFTGVTSLRARILTCNIDSENISIFIPRGIANKYDDPLFFSLNDECRIWKYCLNDEEIPQMDEDLKNGIWNQKNKEELKEHIDFVFQGSSIEPPDAGSDGIYRCVYNDAENKFTDEIHNSHSILLIYDSDKHEYWGIISDI